jgi:AcrR family transcriptional regulator
VAETSRPYRSALREEQARATRRRIVAAGRELFVTQGYGPTTVDAIADRAGVSRKTVFTSVGGKAALLKLAWDWTLAGDDEPVPMAERPEVIAVFTETDPGALIRGWTRLQTGIAARLAPVLHVLTVAADGDPDVAALQAVNERTRMRAARAFVERLEAVGGLRPDLSVERATDIAAVFMDPVPVHRLVLDGGWTVDEYAALLDRLAIAALRG